MTRVTLSTTDNPYDPFKQYELWVGYDEKTCGYNTASLLARFAPVDPRETRAESIKITDEAIDRIIAAGFPLYSPVTKKKEYYKKVYASR